MATSNNKLSPEILHHSIEGMITQAVEEWLEENKGSMVSFVMGRIGGFTTRLEAHPGMFATALTIARQDVLEKQLMEVSLEAKGRCPECDQKVKNWHAPVGWFAPEAWATIRESGIDPATGHKLSCSKGKK